MAENSFFDSLNEQKKITRKRTLEVRDRLSAVEIADKSRHITNRLLEELPVLSAASVIMAYLSFGGEFLTGPLLEEIFKAGKEVLVPAVDIPAREIRAYRITNLQDDLMVGHYGIREPVNRESPVDVCGLDFILVPGVAFDARGNRIGYGAGYYDRFLAAAGEVIKVSACFNCQLRDRVPVDEHDVRVDLLVTEDRIIECNPLI